MQRCSNSEGSGASGGCIGAAMQMETGLQGDAEVQQCRWKWGSRQMQRCNVLVLSDLTHRYQDLSAWWGALPGIWKRGNEEKSLRNLQENRKRSKTVRRPFLHDITCQAEVGFDAEIRRSASTIKVPTANHREKNPDGEKAPEWSKVEQKL